MGKGLGPLWRRPRYVPEAPGKPAKVHPDAKKSAREGPRARQADQNRRRVTSRNQKIKVFPRCSFESHRRSNFSLNLAVFPFVRKVCEPLKVLRLPVKTEVRHFAMLVEPSMPRHLKKCQKSIPESTIWDAFGHRAASDSTVLGASGS